jgi:1,4-dihydroxy-2-naphthoate octaprenyltransferase
MVLLRALASLSRPLHMLLAVLTYWLGVGLARYLGANIKIEALWIGLFGVLLAQMSMGLLSALFLPSTDYAFRDTSPEQRRMLRGAALYASIAALAALGLVAFALRTAGSLGAPVLICLAFSLLVIVLYAVPPARLQDHGLGELLLAIQMAYLVPTVGFLLQAGRYHALLNACAIALTLLLLATFLALSLPSYATDLLQRRASLMLRLGWERGLRIHHLLVAAAYIVLLLTALTGRSLSLFSTAFLAVPFAILQIHFLRNIALGAKPLWSLVRANALAVFGLTTYLLALSFWLR